MEELAPEILERVDDAEGDDPVPYRVYAFYGDRVPAPALYVEVEVVEDGRVVPVIAHNFRYYERAMRRWDANVVEAIVLNELHELTHWAMSEEKREDFDAKSREHGLPDGYWLNGPLLEVIEWVGDGYPDVVGRDVPVIGPIGRGIAWRLRRVLARLRSEIGSTDGAEEDAL